VHTDYALKEGEERFSVLTEDLKVCAGKRPERSLSKRSLPLSLVWPLFSIKA
jgi:hypothetical protein